MQPRIWGLTGGIASGKSSAARFFADLGIPVLDADQVSRALTDPGGAGEAAVRAEFGTTDRAELRRIVFADPARRAKLESILHPLIRQESGRLIASLASSHPKGIVIYEATLLVETGRYKDFEGLIVIESPRELRKQRLIARNGHSDEMAEKILDSQASDEQRRAAATAVILNDGDLGALRKRVEEFARARDWV